MSGLLTTLFPGLIQSDPDEVAIRVGDTGFIGWQQVFITLSCETIPNTFQMTASTEFFQGDALSKTRPGQPCQITVGGNVVITGWIDRRTISADPNNHQVTITGRGMTRNLVDCSVDPETTPGLVGNYINAPDVLELARNVCATWPYIKVSAPVDVPPLPLSGLSFAPGQTPYEVIESAARYTGFLVYEDANGNLVLDRVSKEAMASGFGWGDNIETIQAERSVDSRYSDYVMLWTPVGTYQQFGPNFHRRAASVDEQIKAMEKRPKYQLLSFATPEDNDTDKFGQQMADWEMNRRVGRSNACTITCDSWRDSGKTLWKPNRLAPVDAPQADISDTNWIIGTVTFRKDMSGTHADLVLMPPEAFMPEPTPLNRFPAQFVAPPVGQGDPAPPSTTPPTPPTLGEPPT